MKEGAPLPAREGPLSRKQLRGRGKTVPVTAGVVALVLVAVAVPLIAGVSLTTISGNQNARELTRRGAAVESAGIATLVSRRLHTIERIVHDQNALFSLNVTQNLRDPRPLSMLAAVRSLGPCSAVYFTTPDGHLFGYMRKPQDENGGHFALWTSWENQTTCQLPCDPSTGEVLQSEPPDWCDSDYFGNASVWFRIIDPSVPGSSSWTPIYWSHYVYVSFSLSVRDEADRFVGVLGVDIILGSIRDIIEPVETNGIGVLMERDSEIFLGSTDASLNAGGRNQTTGEVTIFNISEISSANELLRVAQDAMMSEYGSWNEACNSTFWTADRSTVVSVSPIERNGLRWLLVVASRPTLVMVDMNTLGAVLGITVAFLIVAVVVGWLFVRPINSLSADMAAISQLDFSAKHTKQRLSRLREVREMQKSFLRLRTGARALTRYVPSEVALGVMRSESGDLQLDMKLAPLTMLFTDLKGFTSMSELLPHDILISLLNHWFQAFGKVIQANGGTIDKFIGDCIMALYGAPNPIVNPELAACRSALGFKQAVQAVNEFAEMHELPPPIEYRVGIHTGQVLVGHLGYSEHVNYTVCGNAANVASRMEQLGKEYGITPLVSGDVAAKVEHEFLCVFLDVVLLRGHKTVRTRVFHLLQARSSATSEDHETVRVFEEIHGALRSGEPSTALDLIAAARAKPFLSEYRKALLLLRKHIRSGATCKESYIEQQPSP